MKRYLCILTALLMLVLSACQTEPEKPAETAAPTAKPAEATDATEATEPPSEDRQFVGDFSYDPGTDYDARFAIVAEDFFETEDAFYWHPEYDEYMRYAMKDGSDWGVLCPRPECQHDGGNAFRHNPECGGYIDSIMSCCGIYDGKLYYVSTDNRLTGSDSCGVIFRMELDGSAHKRVGSIPSITDSTGHVVGPQCFCFHRGMIFMYALNWEVENGEPTSRTVYAVSPIEGGEYTIMYESSEGRGGCIDLMGEYCYIFNIYNDERGENGVCVELLRWSMVTGELEKLSDSTEPYILPNPGTLWMRGDGNVYTKGRFVKDRGVSSVMYLKDGEWEELLNFEDDGEVIYSLNWISDGIAIAQGFTGVGRFITEPDIDVWIKRFDGGTVFKGKLPMDWLESEEIAKGFKLYQISYAFGDENVFYYEFVLDPGSDGNRGETVLVKYEMTADGPVSTIIGTRLFSTFSSGD